MKFDGKFSLKDLILRVRSSYKNDRLTASVTVFSLLSFILGAFLLFSFLFRVARDYLIYFALMVNSFMFSLSLPLLILVSICHSQKGRGVY